MVKKQFYTFSVERMLHWIFDGFKINLSKSNFCAFEPNANLSFFKCTFKAILGENEARLSQLKLFALKVSIGTTFGLGACIANSTAQSLCNVTIKGTVTDKHNKEPLSYATILWLEGNLTVATNEQGVFSIPNLCPGTYTLICSHVGCLPDTQKVVLKKNTTIHFKPEHHALALKQVILLFQKEKTIIKGTGEIEQIDGKQLDQLSGAPLAVQLLQLNGVTSLKTGTNIDKPVIHGFSGNRLVLLVNGIRQEAQQWGSEHAPEVDPFTAGKITLVKGPASLLYGPDAIGGAIVIEPPAINNERPISGKTQAAFFSNGRGAALSAMLNGKIKSKYNMYWQVQGSTKTIGDRNTPTYYLKNTGNREYNAALHLVLNTKKHAWDWYQTLYTSKIGIFSASHFGNLSDLDRAIQAPIPLEVRPFSYAIGGPYQQILHSLNSLGYAYKPQFNNPLGGSLNVKAAFQSNSRSEYDKHPALGTDPLKPAMQLNIQTYQAHVQWLKPLSHKNSFQLGAMALMQENQTAGANFIPNFRKFANGLFAMFTHHFNAKFTFETGLRYDIVQQQAFLFNTNTNNRPLMQYRSPSAVALLRSNWGAGISSTLQLAYGWRPPGINELFSNGLHHGAAAVEIGNRQLKAERAAFIAWNWVVDNPKYLLKVEPWAYDFSNFIQMVPMLPATLTIRGAFPTFVYQQLPARIVGVDFSLKYVLAKNWDIAGKYAAIRAINTTNGNWLPLIPPDRFQCSLLYKTNLHKKTTPATCSIIYQYVLSQTRYAVGSDYLAPPPAYGLLQFQMTTEWNKQKRRSAVNTTAYNPIRISILINNLTNRVYRDYLNRFRYFANETGIDFQIRITQLF